MNDTKGCFVVDRFIARGSSETDKDGVWMTMQQIHYRKENNKKNNQWIKECGIDKKTYKQCLESKGPQRIFDFWTYPVDLCTALKKIK